MYPGDKFEADVDAGHDAAGGAEVYDESDEALKKGEREVRIDLD